MAPEVDPIDAEAIKAFMIAALNLGANPGTVATQATALQALSRYGRKHESPERPFSAMLADPRQQQAAESWVKAFCDAPGTPPHYRQSIHYAVKAFVTERRLEIDDRGERALNKLSAKAKAQLDGKVPDLIAKAGIGLGSLSEAEEATKIAEISNWTDDLLDKLQGLSLLGDTARAGDDANAASRAVALSGLQTKIYDAVPLAKEAADKRLKGMRYGRVETLELIEEALEKDDEDWWGILCKDFERSDIEDAIEAWRSGGGPPSDSFDLPKRGR